MRLVKICLLTHEIVLLHLLRWVEECSAKLILCLLSMRATAFCLGWPSLLRLTEWSATLWLLRSVCVHIGKLYLLQRGLVLIVMVIVSVCYRTLSFWKPWVWVVAVLLRWHCSTIFHLDLNLLQWLPSWIRLSILLNHSLFSLHSCHRIV